MYTLIGVKNKPNRPSTRSETIKNYLEISKQIDWVMYGFLPALFVLYSIVATFELKLVELSFQKEHPEPPFYVMGLALVFVSVVTFVALIGACCLKRDQIKLWTFLAELERLNGLEQELSYFAYQAKKFRNLQRPFDRLIYKVMISTMVLVMLVVLIPVYCCFFNHELGYRILGGLYENPNVPLD
jgi:hypothetical protein